MAMLWTDVWTVQCKHQWQARFRHAAVLVYDSLLGDMLQNLTEVPLTNRYYVEVAPCDVQAVLENHTHIEDIDITHLPLLANGSDQDSLQLPTTPQKGDRG